MFVFIHQPEIHRHIFWHSWILAVWLCCIWQHWQTHSWRRAGLHLLVLQGKEYFNERTLVRYSVCICGNFLLALEKYLNKCTLVYHSVCIRSNSLLALEKYLGLCPRISTFFSIEHILHWWASGVSDFHQVCWLLTVLGWNVYMCMYVVNCNQSHIAFLQFTFATNTATIIGGTLVGQDVQMRAAAAFIYSFVMTVNGTCSTIKYAL